MARTLNRRYTVIGVVVVVATALSLLLYLPPRKQHTSMRTLANTTWWQSDIPPYNMSLLKDNKDLNRLVDRGDFEFLINNKRCDGVDSLFLIVFIHSAPANFRKRQVIRDTWGCEENLQKDRLRVIFLLGSVQDSALQKRIDQENTAHHDLVQGNFLDSYRNLTYKHVMGLKWVTYFCQQARFIFKADDDIFVDIFQLTHYLKETFDSSGGVANIMMCYVYRGNYVHRGYRCKWRVSFKEYNGTYYPPYCAGFAVLVSPDVVFKLYLESSNSPYFWVDDVHVTGILAEKVGISHVDFSEKLDLDSDELNNWISSTDITIPYLFGRPDSDECTIMNLWNRTLQYYSNIKLTQQVQYKNMQYLLGNNF